MLVVSSFPSIPGKLSAIFLNRLFTLCPAFADVSMNIMFICVAFCVASSRVTCLRRTCDQDFSDNWKPAKGTVCHSSQPCFPLAQLSHRLLVLSEHHRSISSWRGRIAGLSECEQAVLSLEYERNPLVMSNTTMATEESRMYEGMSERNRS